MNGWIKLHRKILDNPIICKDAEYFAVWGYLLMSATHKEYSVIWKGEKTTLNPGQLITGRKKIAEKFKINESKVQRILKKFETEQQIEQQSSNQNRLITIKNWHHYQQNEQQNEQPVNNHRTTSEQPLNTNKNEKNEKNEKNRYYKYAENLATIIQQKKNIKINGQKLRQWTEEIRKLCEVEGISEERLNKAIEWYAKNIGGEYIPVIESGKTLREKFSKLEDAMDRENKNNKKVPGNNKLQDGQILRRGKEKVGQIHRERKSTNRNW